MKHILEVLALSFATLSCAGPSQQGEAATAPPASPPAAQAPATDKKEGEDKGLVCEFVTVTGSNIPQRVCRDKKDKDKRRIEDQESVRRIRPVGSPTTH